MKLLEQDTIDITPWCIRLQPAASMSPELKQYQNEKGRINFGDTGAVNAYNRAAFRVMADLEVSIPPGNLVPTACLRQSYLTILSHDILSRGSRILEIGTGASAVIAMLAAKIHGLKVTATEIDPISYQHAEMNISQNQLQDRIELIQSHHQIIEGLVDQEEFDAVLCYPPTYPEYNRKQYRQNTTGMGFQGTEYEMIGGGEDGYEFIRRYIDEAFRANIRYITVLLIFEEHRSKAIAQCMNAGFTPTCVTLRAGTRERYLVVVDTQIV